jgi:hypothetical protein
MWLACKFEMELGEGSGYFTIDQASGISYIFICFAFPNVFLLFRNLRKSSGRRVEEGSSRSTSLNPSSKL